MKSLSFQWLSRFFCLFGLILLPLTGSAQTLLIYGDSLSAGFGLQQQEEWPYLLQQKLSAQGYDYQVINASISGETTAGGLARLPAVLEKYQPQLVVLELGANDGLRGQSLQQMYDNLAAIIRQCQARDARVILAGIHIPPNYGSRYSQAFYHRFVELQATFNIPLIPFLLDGIATDSGLMQADGLHPTAKAQHIIVETVWKTLQPLLQHRQ